MRITVGNYTMNGTFESKEEAEKVFLNDFPDVTPSRLKTELNKHFKNVDKSRNAISENKNSEKPDAKISKGGTGEK